MSNKNTPNRADRTIYRGADHPDWYVIRHVAEATGQPIIPTAGKAQVRSGYGGALWVECVITIDPVDGWVTVSIPEEATEGAAWDTRKSGVWDLEVVVEGNRSRWAEGRVTVSQDVTRNE